MSQKTYNRRLFPGILLTSVITLSACSGVGERTSSDINRGEDRIGSAMASPENRRSLRAGGAQVSEGIFVAATAERADQASLLPSRLQGAGAVHLKSRDALDLPEIMGRLTEITGVTHLAALGPSGILSSQTNDVQTASDSVENSLEPRENETPPRSTSSRITGASSGDGASSLRMRPSLRGPLSSVLDEVASHFDVEWSYSDGRIIMRDFVTRQYQLSALPSDNESNTKVGSGDITSDTSTRTDFWEEIESSLAGIVGDGASISLGSGTGLVTVTAKVSDHDRISSYMDQMNATMGKQIHFDVNVLSVSLDEAEGVGVDIDSLLAGSAGNSIGWTGSGDLAGPAAGAVNIGIIDGDFSLSSVVRALSSQGRVSVETRTGATTSNNRMVPVEVVENTTYISEIETNLDDEGNITSRTPRTSDLITGFQMQLFPRILNNREIMVQYTIGLSDLNSLDSFDEGGSFVQLPQTSSTTFEQQAMLENGQTLVLAGFERMRATEDESGVGRSGFLGLGGRKEASRERVATVMMITPRILNRRAPIR